jgi:hypothetical protein
MKSVPTDEPCGEQIGVVGQGVVAQLPWEDRLARRDPADQPNTDCCLRGEFYPHLAVGFLPVGRGAVRPRHGGAWPPWLVTQVALLLQGLYMQGDAGEAGQPYRVANLAIAGRVAVALCKVLDGPVDLTLNGGKVAPVERLPAYHCQPPPCSSPHGDA